MKLRRVLVAGLVTALAWGPAVAPAQPQLPAAQASNVRSGRWSDPGIWTQGIVPASGSPVTVARGTTVEYDLASDRELASLEIQGILTFSRQRSTRLDVGNIIIRGGGVLEMGTAQHPIPGAVATEIRLVVPEGTTFVGGDFAPGDIGIWVLEGGRWDVHGDPVRHTWVRLARPARSGDTSVMVREDVSDWPRGAMVVVTPTSMNPAEEEFEERTTAGVRRLDDGLTAVMLATPLARHHDGGGTMTAEIALLSRNVRVISKYPGRPKAHTVFMAGASGSIAYAEFRDLGTLGLLGRYPIHFHRMSDSSRGMAVRGASIWRSGNHFLNIHGSNGILVEDTVGYDAAGSGFFIEATQGPPQQRADQVRPRTKDERAAEPARPRMTREERLAQKQQVKREREQDRRPKDSPSSNNVDLTFIHNLAAKGTWQPGSLDEPHRVALFWVASFNAVLIDNVAVGAKGRRNSSGFHLAEHADRSFSAAPLVMVNNEAHSNADHGFFAWTNEKLPFDVVGFRGWRNGQSGMALGAYNHRFRVFGASLFSNGQANLAVWVSRPWIQDATLEGSKVGLFFHPHPVVGEPGDPGLIVNTVFRSHTTADVSQDHRPCERPEEEQTATSRSCVPNYARFVRPQFHSTRPIDFGWHESAHSWIDLVDWANRPAGLPAAFRLTRKDRTAEGGQYVPAFDAQVRPMQISVDLPPAVTLHVTGAARGRTRVRAQVHDDHGVAAVEFLADGVVIRRLEAAPYEIEWPMSARSHRRAYIYARAVDTAGNVAYSRVVRLELPAP